MSTNNGTGLDLSVLLDEGTRERLLKRLEAKTEKTDTCWLWKGYLKNQYGHGALSVHNRAMYIHQLAYAILVGPIPKGRTVCHGCDVPNCWRQDHLFLGTQLENIADMIQKRRGSIPPRIAGERHHKVTLSDAQVAEIRRLWCLGGVKQRDLAHRFHCTQSTVWRFIHGVTRTC